MLEVLIIFRGKFYIKVTLSRIINKFFNIPIIKPAPNDGRKRDNNENNSKDFYSSL